MLWHSASHPYTCKAAVVLPWLLTFSCCYFRIAKQLWQQVCTPWNLFFKTRDAIMKKKEKKKVFDSSVLGWRLCATKGGNVFQELGVPAHWKGQTMAATLGKSVPAPEHFCYLHTWNPANTHKELNISQSTFCLCAASIENVGQPLPLKSTQPHPFYFFRILLQASNDPVATKHEKKWLLILIPPSLHGSVC